MGWSSWSSQERGWSDGKWRGRENGLFFFPFSSSLPPPCFWIFFQPPFLFFLLFSDFAVPFFPLLFSCLLSTLSPFPSYILLLPSLFLSVHDLLVSHLTFFLLPAKREQRLGLLGQCKTHSLCSWRELKESLGVQIWLPSGIIRIKYW